MSEWKLVAPEATINKVLNPSAGAAGNFASVAGAVVARSTDYSYYGLHSFEIQSFGGDGIRFTLATLANAEHTVTMRARGVTAEMLALNQFQWSVDGAVTTTTPELALALEDDWELYEFTFPAAKCSGSEYLYVLFGGFPDTFYLDGIQVEEKGYRTTYCDGEREGCGWNGAPHGSSSSRSAHSRAGGRERDFYDDYGFRTIAVSGIGAPDLALGLDSYALLPGGALNAIKIKERYFTLAGELMGSSMEDLHTLRQALVAELAHDRYPADAAGWQPARLLHTESGTIKEISAHYQAGLELSMELDDFYGFMEKFGLIFAAEDPHWYGMADRKEMLESPDTATMRYIAGRLRSTGKWDDLGLTANPTTEGTVTALAFNRWDGRLYVGGSFTGLNGVAGRDYIAAYNLGTGEWETVGDPSDANGTIYALAIAPNGDVYAGGEFTNLGGADGDYVAYYDLSSGAWTPLASGGNNVVQALCFGLDGTLYIGGMFDNWNALPDADGIVKWDGAAYSALAAGLEKVAALACGIDGTIYIGGHFTAAGYEYVAQWDGTAYDVLGYETALNNSVYALCAAPQGGVYVGGAFTNAGGLAGGDYVAYFSGSDWRSLGSGLSGGLVRSLCLDAAGMLYVGGDFTAAGGMDLANRLARWNGASWIHADIDLPGAPYVYALATGPADPVVTRAQDLFLGFSTTGSAMLAETASVTNRGTAPAWPLISITRTGITSARLETIRNETTGMELLFDYDLMDGETLEIDLRPGRKSIRSSYFGDRMDAALANSDFGQFCLLPGENVISMFLTTTVKANITAGMLWREPYRSVD